MNEGDGVDTSARRTTGDLPEDLPATLEPAVDASVDLDFHVCVCCGRLLGDDPEDEIDGEGSGRDICGNCNRGRNWDAIESMEDYR